MSDKSYAALPESNDDLPRTLRRERDARDREAREREAREREAREKAEQSRIANETYGRPDPADGPSHGASRGHTYGSTLDPAYGSAEVPDFNPGPAFPPAGALRPTALDALEADPGGGLVTRLNIPFFHLMSFFLKAVFAAIPAILLLGAILWGIGHLLQVYFPQLVKMQILVWFPNG